MWTPSVAACGSDDGGDDGDSGGGGGNGACRLSGVGHSGPVPIGRTDFVVVVVVIVQRSSLRLLPGGLQQLQLFEPGHCRLESRVIVQRHLVVDVLLPRVPVIVVLVRPAHQRPVQRLRVRVRAPVRVPAARLRPVRTRAAGKRNDRVLVFCHGWRL